jgi:hypothetical protein
MNHARLGRQCLGYGVKIARPQHRQQIRRQLQVVANALREALLLAGSAKPSAYTPMFFSGLETFRGSMACSLCTSPPFVPTHQARSWCIKGTQSEETHQFDVRIDHGVSAWSQIVRSEVPTRGRPRPNENWCLWILCASSIPAIVTAALANDLKPRMGPHLCLIAR